MNLFRAALLLLGIGLVWLCLHIDYGYASYVIKRKLEGKSVEQCLDFPPKYWVKIRKCFNYDLNGEEMR